MQKDAGTELFEVPTQPHEYTQWQHPFRNLQIYLHCTALRAISTQALQSLKSKESSEIGGILWGRTLASPNKVTAIIAEAEFVRSEGLLYNTGPIDYTALLKVLKRPTDQAGRSIVGYFRSHIREDLCLSSQDEDLITRHIPDPNSIFLLARPFDIGVCMAAFFFWENGKLQTDGSDLEVPFLALEEPKGGAQIFNGHRGNLYRESDDILGATGEDKPANEPRGEEAPTTPEPKGATTEDPVSIPIIQIPLGVQMRTVMPAAGEDTTQSRSGGEHSLKLSRSSETWRRRNGGLFAWTAAFVLLSVMAGGAYFALPALRSYLLAAPVKSHSTQIDLSVVRARDGQLDVSWNRDAPEFAKAQSARITITDGSLYRELKMDGAQLRSGKLAYLPINPDVQFRLEVYLDSRRSIAESVRVISPASKTSAPELISQSGSGPKATTPLPVLFHDRSASVTRNETSVNLRSRVNVKLPNRFDPKGLVSQVRKEARPPEVPLSFASEPNPSYLLGSTNLNAAPPFVTPARAAQTTAVASPTGAISTYVRPRPIKRVLPNWTQLGQPPLVYKTTQIEVQVNIDATGRVTQARVTQNGDKSNMRLASSAVAAAKEWTFEPATIHGKPIAADFGLVFVFRPSSR